MSDKDANSELLEASRVINSSLDLHETLNSVACQAAKVMNAEGASVLLLEDKSNKLIFKAAHGQKADELIDQIFDADLGIAGKVLRTRKPELVNDVSQNNHFLDKFDTNLKFTTRNLICAPMIYQAKPVGVLEVLNSANKNGFSEADLELLEIFANLASIGTVNAQRYEGLKRQNQGLLIDKKTSTKIIGAEGPLSDVLSLVNKVAHTNATVLLLGETGTGKELIARMIHEQSPRSQFPFVAINCAALPENLLESELFGHEKGSFTGAIEKKLGRFELAEGGTIFLDEVGELSASIQVKLLRVLQEKEFIRVGGSKTILTNVRIIAATNRDLKQAMNEKKFREDLYYRLNVFPIFLPPLRERRDNIPELVNYYINRIAVDLKIVIPSISREPMNALVNYSWPGNIRELQNVIERAVLLSGGGEITNDELPKEVTGAGNTEGTPQISQNTTLPEQEKLLILQALQKNNWNQTKAASELGISRDNIRYRIKKFGLKKKI